ncbi:TerB family tellurite resistance protein [Arcticibacter tournemirensis]
MKKMFLILSGVLSLLAAQAQSFEAQQLLLNYEKLIQMKDILADMKKGYAIVSKGYNTIKDISEGNFNLHDAFIQGLMAVNPAIKNYKRVPDIISYQKSILSEYKSAFQNFKNSGVFNSNEIGYLGNVYGNLFNQSLQNLDELATVVTASKLSMSDDERLNAIDRIFADTEDKLQFLRDFNRQTQVLVLQRSKEKKDVSDTQKLYHNQ